LESAGELQRLSLFAGLSPSVLDWLRERLSLERLETGTPFLREGDPGTDLFVILEGELEITKGRRGGATRVALLGPGDWLGEMSLLSGDPRSAGARVLAPSRLLRFGAGDLEELRRWDLASYAIVLRNLACGLSRRLKVADGLFADFVGRVVSRGSVSMG
jgi:CRP-like cAMP-binding protein